MTAPTASAGPDQTGIEPGTIITLTGSGVDPDVGGSITLYAWTQTGGSPTVTLGGSGDVRTFEAPYTIAGATLTFTLTVTDNTAATGTDTVQIVVLPATERAVIGNAEVPVKITIISS